MAAPRDAPEKRPSVMRATAVSYTHLRSHRRYWVLRRAQDTVFSLLALILLAPLALLISLAIVLDSPGDGAIFRQRRVGDVYKRQHLTSCLILIVQF